MKKTTLTYKTVFISDVHLGTRNCRIDEVNHFLKHTHCEKLVLNGDIIDALSLTRRGRWTEQHTRFIRLVLKKLEKHKTEVIYLRGNHDDILTRFLPLSFSRLVAANQYIHTTKNRRYLVVHGDGFDAIAMNHKWLAALGAFGYQSLLHINRGTNRVRTWMGKETFSLSKRIKARVKSAVNYLDNFEAQLQNFAHKNDCNGIVCGHTHTAEDKMLSDVHYLNSGDWVESLTSIVEHSDGRMEVLHYKDFLNQLEAKTAKRVIDEIMKNPVEANLPPLEDDVYRYARN